MSFGLRVWDSSGNAVLDVNDRLPRFLNSIVINATNGSASDAALAGGSPWSFLVLLGSVFAGASLPTVTISGTTIIWTYPSGATPCNCILYYGLY